jgi:hypothetical protein
MPAELCVPVDEPEEGVGIKQQIHSCSPGNRQ